MSRNLLIIVILAFWTVGAKCNDPYAVTKLRGGMRFLSLKQLNNALTDEGLAKLNTGAISFYLGETLDDHQWLFNSGISVLGINNTQNGNTSYLLSWGPVLGIGYKIWKNNRMCLYPYFDMSYMFTRFGTQQEVNSNSFSSVYAQPAVMRSFVNSGELGAALGLSYQIQTGKKCLLSVSGGYNFRLWQSKWKYLGNKVDFPKVDCRGWEIGITWGWMGKRYGKNDA